MTISTEQQELIEALVSVMDELTLKECQIKTELSTTQKEIEKIQFQMEEILKEQNKEIITCGYWSFGYKTAKRTAFDQKKFKEIHPDLYEKFKTTSENKRFCFGHLNK